MNFALALPESVKVWSQAFHPITMWGLLALSVYTLYLGWQYRRTRTTEDKELKKELAQKRFNTRHHQTSSVLLSLMVLGCLGGMAVTYINNGKLFLGPHLIAGLGMVGLISTSAALVPFMQKGNDWARYTHISLNVALLGLFGWQALTGMQIVSKILGSLTGGE